MDSATFLTVILVLVSIILLGVAVYLLVLIHEARESLKRVNRIMGFVEDSVIRPASSLGSFASLVREGLAFFYEIRRTVGQVKDRKDSDE